MQDKPAKPDQLNPADIAREAFRRLAARRIAPTPEAYREVYDEVAGSREQPPAEKILADLASTLAKGPGDLALFAHRFAESLKTRDWEAYGRQLNQFITERVIAAPGNGSEKSAPSSQAVATKLLEQNQAAPAMDKAHSIPLIDETAPAHQRKITVALVDDVEPPPARKIDIPLVDDPTPPRAAPPMALVDDEGQPGHTEAEPFATEPRFNDTQMTRMLREMLVRTLTLPIPALLQGSQELTKESEALAVAIASARSRNALNELAPRFKQFYFRIEMKSADVAEERELLLRLFKLLIENVGELVDDDSWLAGQIANIQEILAGTINYATLLDATRSLKEVIYKQSLLKHSLAEAKNHVKEMVLTVIDRLGAVASNAEEYHQKIERYSEKISKAQNAAELNGILDHVMQDTRIAQLEAQRSHDTMVAVRQEVQAAEARIHELEVQLVQMSELAHEDQLTGSLNRRGLDEVLEREMARAERKKSPLCVALLDLDDFKKLNDTHGHSAGDGALVHLVKVVKDTLRAMDVIARFGGEEFLIVLPHTPLEDAMQSVTRIQRELTKQIFMHENKRLLITFSSGVALWKENEDQATMIARADEALYKAKKAGKNRVIAAD
ncbi:MAG TPA: GGDEF domain-containing protein [Noviherbaspirillum sp.]|nr:GGDEF domain-containing protein [Noviherbaspirillum sp.]